MSSSSTLRSRVAVIYTGAPGPKAHLAVSDIAAKYWDAGADVRVRRIGPLAVPENLPSSADLLELWDCAADIPEVAPADFAWASVVLIASCDDRLHHGECDEARSA